jgi:hypothetical protein
MLLGAAVPMGEATKKHDLAALVTTPVILGFDASWRPTRRFDIGGKGVFGIATGRSRRCPEPSVACTLAIEVLALARARYYFLALPKLDSWVGIGTGIDFLTNEGQGGNYDYWFYSLTDYYYGPVFGALEVGFDYWVSPRAALGVSVDFALASYLRVKRQARGAENPPYHEYVGPQDEAVGPVSTRSIRGALHAWLLVTSHVTFEVYR